jgi:DGQHR domain-containing protein
MIMSIIVVSAARVKQGNLTLYSTSIKVSDLLSENFYSIERLDPNNQKAGYQRVLNETRAKRLAKYLISGLDAGDSFIPTSIFMATDKDLKFNPENNTLEINITEIGPFSIVDGQHRAEGLRLAAAEDKRIKDFEVPVNIAVSLNSLAQMAHFLIVNTTQKSVDQGVSQQILARLTDTLMTEELPTIPDWIMRAVEKGDDGKALSFVHYMNTNNKSPWFGKIEMANDEDANGTISQSSAVKTIKKFVLVANNPLLEKEAKIQNVIFTNYWQAITDLINPSTQTTLYKYVGFEQFSQFFVPFISHILNKHGSKFTIDVMKGILKEVFDNLEGDGAGIGTSEFWDIGGQAGKFSSGARSQITKNMVQVLAKTLINDEENIEV